MAERTRSHKDLLSLLLGTVIILIIIVIEGEGVRCED